MADVFDEALRLASNIRDGYLRAVTYARIGYHMHRAKKPGYGKAFRYALSAVAHLDNPLLTTKALIEIGTYLHKTGSKSAGKVFSEVHDVILGFPQPLRDELLEELVARLLELGRVDDAFFYTNDIVDGVKRNDTLLKVLRAYLSRGNMRRAYLIVNRMEDEPWRSIAAVETLKAHLKREEFGSAIRILRELRSEYWLGEAMKEVARYLKTAQVPRATYEKFVDIALSLSGETGFDVLKSLLVGLGSAGELEFVGEILRKLPEERRVSILESIVEASLDRAELLEGLLGLTQGDEFGRLADFLMKRLLAQPVGREYVPVVEKIGENTVDDVLLVKVATYLAKLGEFEKAWHFASRVRGNYLRSLAFGSIAVAKLKEGDVDGAIDAALEVKDPRWGSWLLSEILAKILELQAGGEVREDIQERAESQRVLWDEG
ncbi:hypothetical protein [Thermococcus sp.]|uniref:hypothetical protein n=1 Tax=Thermococcus sp. TaxID=35749 RepID=UPI002613FF36|nr:hypothetical protein [Thermococcus sp.]